MTNCKYLKQKINRTLECKKQKENGKNKIINIRECNGCKLREDKERNTSQLKKRTYKQNKREKERYSIIYDDLSVCCVCGSKSNIEINEVYEGAKRKASIENGFCMPVCHDCHTRFHNDREFALYYKRLFQKEFEKDHTRDDFINLIHCNYL